MPTPLPYKITVLCYLFDQQQRLLLLHRAKPPNQGLYSPIGGKLEQPTGESPSDCAIREIMEETELEVAASDLHLTGIVSESGYGDQTHWLMFLYEVLQPVRVEPTTIAEGRLGWHRREQLPQLTIPETDRRVIWPLFWRYRRRFFMAHIDCTNGRLDWRLQQPAEDA